MAYQNAAHIALSFVQIAALKAELLLPAYNGFTDNQCAAALNGSRSVPNPFPAGLVAIQTVMIADVVNALSVGMKSPAYAALTGGPLAVANAYFNAAQNMSSFGNPTMPENLASTWLNEYVTLGLLTAAGINAILMGSDPQYEALMPGGPRAFCLLGEGIGAEVSDVTAARAS